ncbi:MAG: serine hydrolase [Lachnospiraceae bacterium]|nr:serine hydrolase [Lachnospiraceae bacterium]
MSNKNIKRLFQKKIVFFMIFSVVLFNFTGCKVEKSELLDGSIASLGDTEKQSDMKESDALDYLSDGVCVVDSSVSFEDNENITSYSALVLNETTGEMLYEKDMYAKIYPASVTKVLTALVALENCSLNEKVTFSYDATHIEEDGAVLCGFDEGDKISLKNLLYCMLIFSGNDAAYAIAEHVGGDVDTFYEMMNQKAMDIGCVNSHFVNANGLHDKDHYTTAYDMYLIFRQAVTYNIFRKIINTSRYEVPYKNAAKESHTMIVTTTNSYVSGSLQPPANVHVIGGKTGTTSDAGCCLALYSKDKSDNYYISIIFHAGDSYQLYSQMNELLSYIS